MKEPMTARQFALIFWGPIVVIALLVGIWMAITRYNKTSDEAAQAAQDLSDLNARLEQSARNNPAP